MHFMKINLFCLIASIFGYPVNLFSQQYEYAPFPIHDAIWVEYSRPPIFIGLQPYFYCYGLKNSDTIINGLVYHKLYYSNDTVFQESEAIGFLRENNGKIYYYGNFQTDSLNPFERILYNFNLKVGDTIKEPEYEISHPSMLVVSKIDTIIISSQLRKRFHFGSKINDVSKNWAIWIEGIGYLRGLLYPTGDFPTNGLWNDLVCYWQDEKEIYHFEDYAYCMEYLKTNAEKLDFINQPSVFPNPITDQCVFKFSYYSDYKNLEIFDLLGKLRYRTIVKNLTSFKFYNTCLESGLYIYRLGGTSKNAFKGKLIVK
jgi:hypothetical protein